MTNRRDPTLDGVLSRIVPHRDDPALGNRVDGGWDKTLVVETGSGHQVRTPFSSAAAGAVSAGRSSRRC